MRRVDEHHEILVLGAGTAGCAVASTLAAADLQVTMVEAGPDYGAASGNACVKLPKECKYLDRLGTS